MSSNRLYLVVLTLAIVSQQAGICQDKPALPANTNGTSAESKPDEQLEINRNALLNGPSDEIRITAATVMLFSENPLARKFLLDVLTQSENSAARMAVCKALIQARSSKEPVKNTEDFIQPLLGIFATENAEEAQLASEATLIFKYEKIGKFLEELVTDPSKPVNTRINAINALKLRPDMMATIRLIKLLDDSDPQVAEEAKKALHTLGIPVGTDARTRQQIIRDLERKGRDEFLRDWLIRQESLMREMRAELDMWRKSYLTALDKIYATIIDDAAKGNFLAEHLGNPRPKVKLWALEKVSQWRKGTNPKSPADLEPILINLISDPDRDVRLKTARLLSLMRELNSAQRLLDQLGSETDDEVRTALLDALGGAVSYALLPSSSIKISPEIRIQALGWAEKFLSEEDPTKAHIGAGVMRKLLERDGLDPNSVKVYLGMLAEKYNHQKNEPEGGALSGELLRVMAGLCAQDSACKAEAAKLFKPLFEEALRDETDLVREAAVDGLIYIDKANALKRLRKEFTNDRSIKIRVTLINLAGEVGNKDDLTWLAEKIGSNSESGPAWQAMLKIFNGSDAEVLNKWVDKLSSPNSAAKLSNEQRIAFLETAERKVAGENKSALLKSVRERLAKLYVNIGRFEKAADCLGRLSEASTTSEDKEAVLPALLDVYLLWQKPEHVAEILNNLLLQRDLGPDSPLIQSIDNYINKTAGKADATALLDALSKIKTTQRRPNWQQQLRSWYIRHNQAQEQNKTEQKTE